MSAEGAKEKNVPSMKTWMQIEMPIKRIEGALLWLQETTGALTLGEALDMVWSKLNSSRNRKQVEMVGMLTTVWRASRECKTKPSIDLEEWYATISQQENLI